jgi:hypothetical protein
MPTTIATEQGLRSAGAHRTAYGFPRFGSVQVILAVLTIAVLLIAAHASFGAQSAFLGAFDVSVAAF